MEAKGQLNGFTEAKVWLEKIQRKNVNNVRYFIEYNSYNTYNIIAEYKFVTRIIYELRSFYLNIPKLGSLADILFNRVYLDGQIDFLI